MTRKCLAVLAAALLLSVEAAADTGRAIPPGQEELLRRMLGDGATLPGECRFAGGGVEATIVVARYTCGADTVVVELRDAGDAPAEALRTKQFAIRIRSGPAPPELAEALADLVRAREAAFEWRQVSLLRKEIFGLRLGPLALAGSVCVLLLIALVLQALVASGRAPARGSERERTQHRRDVRVSLSFILVAVFLLTRIIFLTRLPVYVDESVHIHWARGILDPHFAAEFSVGRWLPVRIMALFLLLPAEPLFAARLASVSMGLAILAACILINRELFSSTEGLLAGVLYTALPFAFLYDRMALADVYVAAFGAWVIYFAILAARREGQASLLAMSLSAYCAILSKPTGALFLLVPLLVGGLLVERGNRGAYLGRVWPTLLGGATLLLFLLWAGYGSGLLASQVALDGRAQLAAVLLPNLEEAWRWLTALLTPPVAVLAIVVAACALVGGIGGARAEAFLGLLLALSILPFALVSRTWYPSYLLFTVVPIALLLGRFMTVAAAALSRLAARLGPRLESPVRRTSYAAGILLLIAATAPLMTALVMRPQDAALPPIESSRYVHGGLSGFGLPELADFLRRQEQPINVVRFDLVQPPKDGLDVYLSPSDAIHLYAIDHRDERARQQIASLTTKRRTLFVSNPEAEEGIGVEAASYIGPSRRVWSHTRPGNQTRLEVWELGAGL